MKGDSDCDQGRSGAKGEKYTNHTFYVEVRAERTYGVWLQGVKKIKESKFLTSQ